MSWGRTVAIFAFTFCAVWLFALIIEAVTFCGFGSYGAALRTCTNLSKNLNQLTKSRFGTGARRML